MGTWNATIFGNDTSCDTKDEFFERHNRGEEPNDIKNDLLPSMDDEDRFDVMFSLAHCLWETGSLDEYFLIEVKQAIQSGADEVNPQSWTNGSILEVSILAKFTYEQKLAAVKLHLVGQSFGKIIKEFNIGDHAQLLFWVKQYKRSTLNPKKAHDEYSVQWNRFFIRDDYGIFFMQ